MVSRQLSSLNVKAGGTCNNHHSQNSIDESAPSIFKVYVAQEQEPHSKMGMFLYKEVQLQWVGTVVEETGVMWQAWKGRDEVSRCNG
jgi:hypothetical protein